MNSIYKKVCALAILGASSTTVVMASESVDLTVTGTIAPAACIPAFSDGGVVDYGKINSNTLTKADYTLLGNKSVTFSITCDVPAKVGMHLISSRKDSVVLKAGSQVGADGFGTPPVMEGALPTFATGIGFDEGGNKIGGLLMHAKNANLIVDASSDYDYVGRDIGSDVWRGISGLSFNGLKDYSVALSSSRDIPVAFTNAQMPIDIQVYLNKPEEIDLSKEISLDGLVTFELVYL